MTTEINIGKIYSDKNKIGIVSRLFDGKKEKDEEKLNILHGSAIQERSLHRIDLFGQIRESVFFRSFVRRTLHAFFNTSN